MEKGKNQVFDRNGNIVEEEEFEISDDEILVRELAEECNAKHTQMMANYRNWDNLNEQEKREIIKFLIGFYLVAGEKLSLFDI